MSDTPAGGERSNSRDFFGDLLNGFLSRNAERRRADYQIDLDRTPTEPIAQARQNYTRALNDFNRSKFGWADNAEADETKPLNTESDSAHHDDSVD